MCEFSHRIHEVVPKVRGRSIHDAFSGAVQSRLPYHRIHPGHCLECVTPLSRDWMRPYGRTTRSMCEPCYRGLIADRRNSHCFICGGPLPNHKLGAQMKNSREIREHIHDGQCLDYHTLIHCKVIGEDMSFLNDAQGMTKQLVEYSHQTPRHQTPRQMSDLQALQDNFHQQIELVKSLVFEKAPTDMNQGKERVPLRTGRSISSDEDRKVTVIPYPKSVR